jgi:hypothetical protein
MYERVCDRKLGAFLINYHKVSLNCLKVNLAACEWIRKNKCGARSWKLENPRDIVSLLFVSLASNINDKNIFFRFCPRTAFASHSL